MFGLKNSTGVAAFWCKHCARLVSLEEHKPVTSKPLWRILLRFKGESLPRSGLRLRELKLQFKEAAKRFENQNNIQTSIFIWEDGRVIKIHKWDGHGMKWVVGLKGKKPVKKVVKKVRKRGKKKVKRVRRRNRKRCKGCNTLFSPTGRQIYCNRNCGQKTWQRDYNKTKRENQKGTIK